MFDARAVERSRCMIQDLWLAIASSTRAGMIFIPCRGGVSHRPDEFAAPADIARGVQALALTMARLSVTPPGGDRTEL